ncbi:MAG: hypothetical protein WCP29_18625 [Acidobacteriota bacterium]
MRKCVSPLRTLIIPALLLAFAFGVAQADAQSFDLGAFTAPSGWQPKSEQDHVTFTAIDQAAGTYVVIAVYNSTIRSGDWDKDFASEWNGIVARSFDAGAAPRPQAGRTRGGLEFRQGGRTVSHASGTAYAMLLVFAADRRQFSVVVAATHEAALQARASHVQSFVDSLRLATPAGAKAQPSAPAAGGAGGGGAAVGGASGSSASAVPRADRGIAGVWMGFKTFYPDWEPKPRWYVFYENGEIFEDLPGVGLAAFDRDASRRDPNQANYWGTYTADGASGQIAKPGVRFTEALRIESPDKMKIDANYFNRCKSVDGLRLQGEWTSYGNPNDPTLDRVPQGQRPIFRFTSDGRFVDEGVLATFLTSIDRSTDGAGSGTYEIRDFTLILRYADGRVKTLALTGLLGADPAASNDIIFIRRSRFNKRR